MAAPRKLPDSATLLALYQYGLSHAEIGRRYGASGSAVGQELNKLPGYSPRPSGRNASTGRGRAAASTPKPNRTAEASRAAELIEAWRDGYRAAMTDLVRGAAASTYVRP